MFRDKQLKRPALLCRIAPVAAAIALMSLLAGCVVYPAGPYYNHPHYHYWR